MTFGATLASLRKKKGMTQDALAQCLGVTNQAVSKWESDVCCPDIQLLPKLADLFGVTIDTLFGRSSSALPWSDDGVLRIAAFIGQEKVADTELLKELTFRYQGPALNISSELSITCDNVGGNVQAGGSVTCDDISGNVQAGGNVTCDVIDGEVRAGGNITCDEIAGDVFAGGNITCDEIEGNATAGREIRR